jgi:hypothetical protein
MRHRPFDHLFGGNAQASAFHAQGMRRVQESPMPDGQKFPAGTRVKIADTLKDSMRHFPSGKLATVKYTYAHAYGGDNVKSYCLDIDGIGEVSWYYEDQLELVEDVLDAQVIDA